ncbi:MAG: M23 family metallopeptidase [Holosporales bacterium]|nr:M23 family metallopeptidase [Holosporales bacterium]
MAVASAIAMTEYVKWLPHKAVTELRDEDAEPIDDVVNDNDDSAESTEETSEEPVKADELLHQEQAPIPGSVSDNNIPGEHKVVVQSGNSIATILEGMNVPRTEVHLISKSLSKIFNLRSLRVGQEITIRCHADADTTSVFCVDVMEIQNAYNSKIVVEHTNSGYKARKETIPVKKVMRSISGVITPHDPNASLKKIGVNPKIAKEALRSLSQVTNIKSAKSKVNFELLYQDFYRMDGSAARDPELMYVSAMINGKIMRLYKFAYGNGSEYVDQNGTIVRTIASTSSMLSPPLSRMKVTSGFGMRCNPGGCFKLHTGVDLSAVVGTPVRAAANGVVIVAAYRAGYGKYVSIRHNGMISTAYAHLSRIVVRNGQHVSRGQILGYSGLSGNSRGAHLHYEVVRNGQHVNPLLLVKQDPQRLTGVDLVKFNQFKKEINLQVVGLTPAVSCVKRSGKA